MRSLRCLAARNRRRLTALPTKDVHVGCGKHSILHGAIGAHGVANLNVGKGDRVAPLAKGRIFVRDNGVRGIVEHAGQRDLCAVNGGDLSHQPGFAEVSLHGANLLDDRGIELRNAIGGHGFGGRIHIPITLMASPTLMSVGLICCGGLPPP